MHDRKSCGWEQRFLSSLTEKKEQETSVSQGILGLIVESTMSCTNKEGNQLFSQNISRVITKKNFDRISNNNTNKLGLVCEVLQELEIQICKSDPNAQLTGK